MKRLIPLSAAILVAFTVAAQAHHRHHRHHTPGIVAGLGMGLKHMLDSARKPTDAGLWPWPGNMGLAPFSAPAAAPEGIVSHPPGCPSRAFCGCAAAVRVFGYAKRELWLAANWFRFPPAAPGPGMVAVRQHHVFVILQTYGDGTVLAYDGNSGHHLTRIHRVSLAGYSVRNPHA